MNKVTVTDQISTHLQKTLSKANASKVAVLVDENTAMYCLPIIRDLVHDCILIQIKAGEQNKNISTCLNIWQKMTDEKLDRSALLINLGGGVIGDMGGFCAATYKRGIRFINIPTTLLAQVDASIGGKLGIDFGSLKNHIGLFHEPEETVVDPVFLQTLPECELKSGFAEMLKHGLISDEVYFKRLSRLNHPNEITADDIAHSIMLKKQVVEKDPKEKGLRKILNFGHTIGHAVESHYLTTDHPLLHGEAIAIGMVCEAYLAQIIGKLPQSAAEEIHQVMKRFYPMKSLPESSVLLTLMQHDKKNSRQTLSFSLLSTIGKCDFDCKADSHQILEALAIYESCERA
ncbi:3-dehydroquinate synthase [Penaeicola halotolerans]|uniref:3-dehydroquinate synthase n=1 Tax=Penaeicola halotolerans TaxID=2793196 RepID=UPI001CF86D09|nr:3-dehydroquinate synthase [Penaeicola halotolerans]